MASRMWWRIAGVGAGAAVGFAGSAALRMAHAQTQPKHVEVVFMGTGSSVSVPSVTCLLSDKPCTVCRGAAGGDRNERRNPSMLLKIPSTEEGQRGTNVLIDCGKTFRDGALKFFREYGVRYVDVVLLTHPHADAVMGLDDIRDVQEVLQRGCSKTGTPHINKVTDVYCDPFCHTTLSGMLPYLFPKPATDDAPRYTSAINWVTFDGPTRLPIAGLNVTPLKVEHGKGYVTYGFQFESEAYRMVYLSDVSHIPEGTDALLKGGRPIDMMVIDSLFRERDHPTHFSFPKALAAVKTYAPKKTYLTGMSHEFDYYTFNDELRRLKDTDGVDIEMPYDGLKLDLPLL